MLPYVLPIISGASQNSIEFRKLSSRGAKLPGYKISKKKHALLMIKCSILFIYIILLPYMVLFKYLVLFFNLVYCIY